MHAIIFFLSPICNKIIPLKGRFEVAAMHKEQIRNLNLTKRLFRVIIGNKLKARIFQ
jgi:hypothetical protein